MGRRTGDNTKADIRAAAIDLLIVNGYRGTNFRLIAERLGITTTNIHYHFGGKASLVLAVVTEYIDDAIRRQEKVWMRPDVSLRTQLQLAAGLNRQRYLQYNPGENTNQPWSLIWRLRMEKETLSQETISELERYGSHLQTFIRDAVRRASASGELADHAPLENISTMLISLVNSAAAVALDSGWQQLEALYAATSDVIFSAYCSRARERSMRSNIGS